jgi:photosystem II stability/assembly factor-like uncharacterized protein
MTAGAGLLHTTDGGATWTEAARLIAADVDFADEEHGWLVGEGGTIYATADGGETWAEQESGSVVHLTDVLALSATEAWAVGNGEGFTDVVTFPQPTAFLHTTDGGESWRQVETPLDTWFREITFVGQQGWALGQCASLTADPACGPPLPIGGPASALLHTADGGASWSLLDAGVPPVSRNLILVDEQHGWLLGNACATEGCFDAVFRTADGGATWEQLPLIPQHFESYAGLAFRDASVGWLLVQNPSPRSAAVEVRKTLDGGRTWATVAQVDLGVGGLVRRVTTAVGELFITGGGLALRSTDGGNTWLEMEHPALTLGSLDFIDRGTGFAIGGGKLQRTVDGGRTWHPISEALTPFVTEYFSPALTAFFDATHGVAASHECRTRCAVEMQRTTDGGRTWSVTHSLPLDQIAPIMNIELLGDAAALVVGANGLLTTVDGGLTWNFRDIPPSLGTSISEADAADAMHLWATVSDGSGASRLVRSDDGGVTWSLVRVVSLGYEGFLQLVDRHHGWYTSTVCTDSECKVMLFATADGGATWRESVLGPESMFVYDLVFVDQLNGWLSSQSCFDRGCATDVIHTADGGRTWRRQLSGDYAAGETLFLGTFDFVDPEHGWFLLHPGRGRGPGGGPPQRTLLYHTTDGGGGPIGRVTLPDVGTGADAPSRSAGFAPALLALGGALALAAPLLLRRRR